MRPYGAYRPTSPGSTTLCVRPEVRPSAARRESRQRRHLALSVLASWPIYVGAELTNEVLKGNEGKDKIGLKAGKNED